MPRFWYAEMIKMKGFFSIRTSDDSISRFKFLYDDTIFWKYRDIDIDIDIAIFSKYVNLVQTQEQDVNVQQGSLLYVQGGPKNGYPVLFFW